MANWQDLERWPHQKRGVRDVTEAIDGGGRRIVLTAPTGAGKSLMLFDLIRWADERNWPVAAYVNRTMLFDQLSENLEKWGIDHGKRARGHDTALLNDVQLAMTQTELSKVYRNKKRELHRAKLVLVDECHNQTGDVMKRIIQDHVDAGAAVVGVTATPLDLDGIYEELIQAGTTSELRDCGALVPAYTYGPDEPDTRHIKRQKTGEFSYGDVKKVIMTQTIFGRVFEWWKKLNPDERPALLFAPGVKESLWFAQEFESRKVRAAHIDGDQIYIDNKTLPSTSENRAMLAEESREGRLPIVCNRFVMREGIDWPWLYHGIFATVFGSLTSFIQSGGRLLRAHPSLSHVVIQDHGGGWWRHGSLNADRIWKLGQGALELSNERFEKLRKKEEPEPILCPKCCRPRLSGPECPGCGYTHTSKSRLVVQADGSLVPYRGDIFKPRVVREESDTVKKWLNVYYRCKNAKRPMTFTQALAVFKQEHGYYPPATLPMMPKSDVDAHRQINSVKYNDLIPREKPQAVKPQPTLFE